MIAKSIISSLRILTGMCFLVLLHACGKEGETFLLQQDIDPFDSIQLNAVFDVHLIQGDHYAIRLEGDELVCTDVAFKIENNTLIVDNSNSGLWKHPRLDPPLITITFVNISQIHAEETCNIISPDTIHAETFGISLGGKLNYADLKLDCSLFYYWNTSPTGGAIKLAGRSDIIRLYNGTLMAVDADQFSCHEATVENGSKSDIHVFVDQKLDYSITGTGNIYVRGNPADITVGALTSTGRLIQ